MPILDPTSLLHHIQLQLRDVNSEIREDSITASESEAEARELARQQAMEAAKKAAEEAGGFLGTIQRATPVLKVAVAAAAIAATVTTGGAALALAVAGAALILAADKIADAAVEIGLVSEEDAQWVELGCQIAGSIMTLGSGAVSGGAALFECGSAVTTVAQAVETVATVAEKTTTVIVGYSKIRHSLAVHEQTNHELDAETEASRSEDATQHMDESASELRQVFEQFHRIAKLLKGAMQAQAESRMTAIAARA